MARRTVLLASGSALVLGGIRSSTGGLAELTGEARVPDARLHLVRPQDMLVLDLEFHNLQPVLDANPPELRRVDQFAQSFVVARFGSQHVMEETIYQSAPVPEPGGYAALALPGSRIVFALPETMKSLPYSEEGLLRWWQWLTQAVDQPSIPDPNGLSTDLLVVDWLHITPDPRTTWAHASAPVTHHDRTELWHTRLAVRGSDGRPYESIGTIRPAADTVPVIRAFHADKPKSGDDKFKALRPGGHSGNVPQEIVEQSYQTPVRADLLSLSATGATVDLEGKWEPSAPYSVRRWDHHTWQGRDNKVVIEQYGFLVPFGHRAIYTVETKRVFDDQTGAAYLRQREFVKPHDFTRVFPAPGQQNAGRAFPFREVTITTTVLPILPENRESVVPGVAGAFWIQDINAPKPDGSGHADVVFTVAATDLSGHQVSFTTPMAFILSDRAVNPGDHLLEAMIAKFGTLAAVLGPTPDRRRVFDLRGQQISYIEETASDTAGFPTSRWFWGLEPGTGSGPADPLVPRFYPRLLCAEAQVPAIDAMIGPGGPAYLVHDQTYLGQGFSHDARSGLAENRAQIYMRVQDSLEAIARLGTTTSAIAATDSPLNRVSTDSSKSGGLVKPDLTVGALSLRFGIMSGKQKSIEKIQKDGEIRAKDYFDFDGQLKRAVLFGGILLGNVVKDFTLSEPGGPVDGALTITKETEYPRDPTGQPDKNKNPTVYRSKSHRARSGGQDQLLRPWFSDRVAAVSTDPTTAVRSGGVAAP